MAPGIQLTASEWAVLQLVAEGLSNKEIAARLKIGEKTVRNRVSEIFDKLGMTNRVQAAIWAREHDEASN